MSNSRSATQYAPAPAAAPISAGLTLGFQQASKGDPEQTRLTGSLQPFDASQTTADVCVVGCGPAGLALAAELGKNGLTVALVGKHVGNSVRLQLAVRCITE